MEKGLEVLLEELEIPKNEWDTLKENCIEMIKDYLTEESFKYEENEEFTDDQKEMLKYYTVASVRNMEVNT